jgi:hypothetical protein
VQVKVDIQSNTWTVAHSEVLESPANPETNETVKVVTETVKTFNPFTQPIPKVETTKTIERKIDIDWNNDPDFDWVAWWDNWLVEWEFFSDWYLSLFDWGN